MTFTDENNRAKLTRVAIDHNNGKFAEVKDGLVEGQRVILYPADTIADGVSVRIAPERKRTRALPLSRRLRNADSATQLRILAVSEALVLVQRGAVVRVIPTWLREGACSSKARHAPPK